MAGFLLINPRAGTEQPDRGGAGRGGAGARDRGARAAARATTPPSWRARADADVLGAAGGDGSVASVAAVAVERDLPFVVVPFGTRNHFARDLGLDRDDPLGALEAFDGEERRVDVGRAGERRFLNNVSLGLYATLVHRREHHRRAARCSPGCARSGWACAGGAASGPSVDGEPVRARVLLVANNAYELSLFSIGERERLDEGRLHLYTARGLLPRGLGGARRRALRSSTRPGGSCRPRSTASRTGWRRRSS